MHYDLNNFRDLENCSLIPNSGIPVPGSAHWAMGHGIESSLREKTDQLHSEKLIFFWAESFSAALRSPALVKELVSFWDPGKTVREGQGRQELGRDKLGPASATR